MGWFVAISLALAIFAIVNAYRFRKRVIEMAVAIDSANEERDRELATLRIQTANMADALIRKKVIESTDWYHSTNSPADKR